MENVKQKEEPGSVVVNTFSSSDRHTIRNEREISHIVARATCMCSFSARPGGSEVK